MASKHRPGQESGGKGKGVVVSTPSSGRKLTLGSSDSKHKVMAGSSVSKSNTALVKGKMASSSSLKVTTKKTTVKAQKKVYTLAGQKFDVPEEREPLRIFYESLSKQIPSSEMAEFWLMEHGMLSPERSKKAYERKQRRQQQIRLGTPIKSIKTERSESFNKPQATLSGRTESLKMPKALKTERTESLKMPKALKTERPESLKKPQTLNNGSIKANKRVDFSDDDEDFIVKRKKVK